MAKRMSMSEADHRLVTDAVAQAELTTDGEIVTIVSRRSDAYHDVGLHWAILSAFIVIAAAAAVPRSFEHFFILLLGGWMHELPLQLFLTLLLGSSIAAFLAVRYLLAIPRLRMIATPGATRRRRVHRRAVALFRTAAEARTMGRTGVLIYLSLDERRAEIVADRAIVGRVDPTEWGDAMAEMLVEVKAGRIGAGMAQAVTHVGDVLARHLPPTGTNPNELPDRLIEL
jgi:putative membrane protein